MDHSIHFISGLPRSGSTLLSALLRQNPRFTSSISGPAGSLFNAMMRACSQNVETSVFLTDNQREHLLRGVFEALYAKEPPGQVIFDTNRLWTSKLPALTGLFPNSKMICCVRDPAWILDSIECLHRKNPYELSAIFNYDPTGTVYSRVDGLLSANGMLGFSISALREGIFSGFADRMLLIRYNSLVTEPLETLAAVYKFIDEAPFAHDPSSLSPIPHVAEFDQRIGTPGLHDVRPIVERRERETVLPPDLFSKYNNGGFWNDAEAMPANLKVI